MARVLSTAWPDGLGRIGIATAMVMALAACAVPPQADREAAERLVLTPVGFANLPGWAEGRQSAAVPALRRSCGAIVREQDAESIGPKGIGGTARLWRRFCRALDEVPAGDDGAARRFFEDWFAPRLASNGSDSEGLFTGYYEPELKGSRSRDDRFSSPLYMRPPDLVSVDLGEFRDDLAGERIAGRVVDGRLRPYESRAEIESGALAGRGLELLWLEDPIDAFFLHIQGSGRIVMPDGSAIRVGYAGSNGHSYYAIGRELVAKGEIPLEQLSMQSLRAWLARNPEEARALMLRNRSFVFFEKLAGDGPLGTQGVPLTPGRSLAVDRAHVALGLPIWLDTVDPLDATKPLRRLVVAQDTGGAIRGPVRGDLFWGHGPEAAERAGRMRSRGRYYILVPRQGGPRRPLVASLRR